MKDCPEGTIDSPRQKVLDAVKRGHRSPQLIACITKLKPSRVHNELGRLFTEHAVMRVNQHEWCPAGPIELEKVWKKVNNT